MVQAKSKAAPMKPLLTIPKLELSAAALLARLTVKVLRALKLPPNNLFLFTDSMDVFHWLSGHPSKWPPFIANKCSNIHYLVPQEFWYHVRSQNNPADCVSRGISPSELINHPLWWEGNKLIIDSNSIMSDSKALKIKEVSALCSNLNVSCNKRKSKKIKIWDLLEKYSDLPKLLRISAYILRFVHKISSKS